MPIEREISFNQLLLQCLRLRVGLQENQFIVRFLRTVASMQSRICCVETNPR
ncbi:hypothetical protein KC19_8G091700 [Ceratodon purpureus]|uniref:Uncharacterized protein n=1 Tax=Ceratodon purpureus TaxID=3225 RepID=A0A8T0GWQ4_CERPU|nr:hypothetical protein KC19_8G091700 [Ceratodon purpureus]